MKLILFYMVHNFDFRSGGHTVQYELAKTLHELGYNVKVRAPNKIQNAIFSNYLENDVIDINNTIVVYAENITNNPINAKYIIRWILAPLGINSPTDRYKTWNKTDLVYYFNSEQKFEEKITKMNTVYKLLNIFYINPNIKNTAATRDGWCYTKRKSNYHKKLVYVHPPNSFEITPQHTQLDYIHIFNTYKYFISYDPCTFLSVIAALCGCISIVKKIDGVSKQEWLNITPYGDILKEMNITSLYGIAYGKEELDYASQTINLAGEQWDNIKKMKNKHILSFIADMEDIENLENKLNTVENNYIN